MSQVAQGAATLASGLSIPVVEVDAEPPIKKARTDDCTGVSLLSDSDVEQSRQQDHRQSEPVKIWVAHEGFQAFQHTCDANTTIGQLTYAEMVLLQCDHQFKPYNGVGEQIPLASKVKDHPYVLLQAGPTTQADRCPMLTTQTHQHDASLTPRLTALWQQKGWVAKDEMEFYLQALAQDGTTRVSEVLMITSPTEAENVVNLWVSQRLEDFMNDDQCSQVFTICWFNRHWFPLQVKLCLDSVTIYTTPEMANHVRQWFSVSLGITSEVKSIGVLSQWPADCGFQAVAWIIARASNEGSVRSMPSVEAIQWRELFARHVLNNDLNTDMFPDLWLAGMASDGSIKKQLQELIETHGVTTDRSAACAAHLIDKLGIKAIQQTFQATKPWQDLKARASQASPAIQIVLSSEQQALIDRRIAAGRPIGRKSNKQKQTPANQPVLLDPSQVQIPSSVFQQEDGVHLDQIQLHQINANGQGIIVASVDEALPYVTRGDAISSEGLAILVINYADSRLPNHAQPIKFPAVCASSGESMLVSAAMYQIGAKRVQRQLPQQCNKIDQVETTVLRIALYRDQTKCVWTDIAKSPVKLILASDGLAPFGREVLDVWDRQYLSKRFVRTKPNEAEVFLVTIRIPSTHANEVLNLNAVDGLYIEPRTDNGRQPHPGFAMTWLPKKSFADVQIAQQTSVKQSWVARSGDRFGLRSELQSAQAIHEQFRPEIEYLAGAQLKTFRVGPVPFGTTKHALAKTFKSWNWQARPGQPLGQSKDHTAVFWSAVSNDDPSHTIFTMEHGDVLISSVPNARDRQNTNNPSIEASKRTVMMMTRGSTQKPAAMSNDSDPWLTYDPWMERKPVTTSAMLSQQQLSALEAKVEQKVMSSVIAKVPIPCHDEDADMGTQHDTRVAELEQKVQSLQENVNALSSNLSTFQQQQTQQNNSVVGQIQALQTSVENQHQHMTKVLDAKMEQQMGRIEQLLGAGKRHKSAE